MSFRPHFLGIVAFIAVSLCWETAVQAQATTDILSWKDAKAEDVHRLASTMLIRFRDVTGTVREELLDKTLSALKDIVADSDVVPSTRYNAILAVGQLVSTEATPGGNLPVAYPAALPYLIDVYQETDLPQYVKYGALLGIVRHTHCGIDSSQQEKVIDLLLKTVMTESPLRATESDEPAVWDWFRLTALEGLTALKTAGANGKVVAELLSLINTKSQELDELRNRNGKFTRKDWEQMRRAVELASQAVKTLGDIDYKSATDVDAKKMTDAFIALTKSVCEVGYKMASDSIEQKGTSSNPAVLLEQIVVDVKTCTQSVVWGIRSGFLTARPAENSFYASLKNDDPEVKRLDILMKEIVDLAAFFDEADRTQRATPAVDAPKEFKFDILELRDALSKISETIAGELKSER
jgi:hypothetical protein